MAQPRVIGELAVVALEAENLPKQRESAGGLKTFCVFRIAGAAKRTKTDTQGGRNPTWDDQVNMTIPHGYSQMQIQVMDEDPKRGERLVCEGQVDLTKVLKEGEQDEWFPLNFQGKAAGDIYLELTFYSARPPPSRQPTRFAHPRPPQMAGAQFARPPRPGPYPPGARPMHVPSVPAPGVPATPVTYPHPPPAPVAYPHQPNHSNFPAHVPPPAPPQAPSVVGYPAQPSPQQLRPVPPGPMRPPRPPGPTGPPGAPSTPTSGSRPVSVGASWRTSVSGRPRPAFTPGSGPMPHPSASYAPVQNPPSHPSPGTPTSAPLLASSFRPGAPPHHGSYNNGYPPTPSGSFQEPHYPGKPLPQAPTYHLEPQTPYPPSNVPPAGFHAPQHPQGHFPMPQQGNPGYQHPPGPYPPQQQYRPYG